MSIAYVMLIQKSCRALRKLGVHAQVISLELPEALIKKNTGIK